MVVVGFRGDGDCGGGGGVNGEVFTPTPVTELRWHVVEAVR